MSNPQPLPSLPYDSTQYLYAKDAGNLNLLATFHYIGGGLTMAFASIFCIHIILGIVMISGKLPSSGSQSPPPPELGWVFIGIGSLAVLIGWTVGVLIIYSGRCIKARRHWLFSLIIAGLMCLNAPLGTVLGVFTFVVLLRDSVKRLYGLDVPPPYPAPPPY